MTQIFAYIKKGHLVHTSYERNLTEYMKTSASSLTVGLELLRLCFPGIHICLVESSSLGGLFLSHELRVVSYSLKLSSATSLSLFFPLARIILEMALRQICHFSSSLKVNICSANEIVLDKPYIIT